VWSALQFVLDSFSPATYKKNNLAIREGY